ncbi:hypothetical protein [Anabaena sp. PCC 7108]|uniref:hypothetical protein n=1 Tax=Anabaena sp. PCC 7108 TaxID=163908 RepID=UPI00178C3C64|nr:hypothetical protein [Anabaena sp. PCC 7108]
MNIVPKVLGINQCSFTVLSPDSHSWESSICILANPHTFTAQNLAWRWYRYTANGVTL